MTTRQVTTSQHAIQYTIILPQTSRRAQPYAKHQKE